MPELPMPQSRPRERKSRAQLMEIIPEHCKQVAMPEKLHFLDIKQQVECVCQTNSRM